MVAVYVLCVCPHCGHKEECSVDYLEEYGALLCPDCDTAMVVE